MRQLFEAVPVSEKPEKDDWYPCLLNNEARSSAHILFARGKWNTHYNITHWLRPIAPAKEAEQSREQIVTNEEMNRVFEGTNFGAMKPREVIAEAVRKIAQGWSNGKTSQQCIKELGLIEYRNNQWGLADKGLKYLLADSKGHQEASTGQAGPTVEDDWVRVELLQKIISAYDKAQSTEDLFDVLSVIRELKKTLGESRPEGCNHEALIDTGVGYYHCPMCNKGFPSTDKPDPIEEEIKRHSDTWDAACTWFENSGGPADDLIPNKKQYLKSLENKLRK